MNSMTNHRLLVILGDVIKEVQLCISCPGGCKRYESNVAARLIHALDHVLLHGLRYPKNGYWPVFAAILPSSALSFINQLSSVTDTLGKGRACLLLCLNEAVLEALLATLGGRPSHLSQYYLPYALLSDSTSLQVVVTLVSGLEHVGFDFLLESAFLNSNPSLCSDGLDQQLALADADALRPEQVNDDFQMKWPYLFLGHHQTTMPAPTMLSPLVKRRSSAKNQHVRSSTQKRVSFHQDLMRRPYDECLHQATSQTHLNSSNYVEDGTTPMNLRRCRSELAIDHAFGTVTLAKYPTIAERGVPEGQEDPDAAHMERGAPENLLAPKASIRRKLLMAPAKDQRQFLDWAQRQWKMLNLVPILPHLKSTHQLIDISDNQLAIDDVSPTENTIDTLLLPIEMDPNERYKIFQCYINFYSGVPSSCQLVISSTIIYVVSSTGSLDNRPSIVWKSRLIDLEYVEVKCNYSVLVMRCSTSVKDGGYYCLDFANPIHIQMAASLIDVNVRKVRNDCQCVYVEPMSQCQTYWQSMILRWIQQGHHSIDVESPIDVQYIGLLYFEESFVTQTYQASPTSGMGCNKSGHLMFRWSNTRLWHPGYFIIKDGVLYQFNHPNDRVPTLKMSLSQQECKGYGRNFHSSRPHTIELQLRDEKSLLLAAASETEATEWLTTLSQSSFVWDNLVVDAVSPSPIQHSSPMACGVLVTRQQIILFQSTDQQQPVASAPLDLISVILINLTDTFCLIELDYREASEGAGDWILYFQSENSFEEFLRATKRPRETLSTASSSTIRNKSLLLRAI